MELPHHFQQKRLMWHAAVLLCEAAFVLSSLAETKRTLPPLNWFSCCFLLNNQINSPFFPPLSFLHFCSLINPPTNKNQPTFPEERRKDKGSLLHSMWWWRVRKFAQLKLVYEVGLNFVFLCLGVKRKLLSFFFLICVYGLVEFPVVLFGLGLDFGI